MDVLSLERFLFICLMINTSIYTITALVIIVFGERVYKINMKVFSLDKDRVATVVQSYLASYKLMITFFNFTPWLALFIINH